MRTTPKEGQQATDNQDRFGVFTYRGAGGHLEIRAALSDGATQSSRAGEWAGVLVKAYLSGTVAPTQRTSSFLRSLPALEQEANRPASWVEQGRALIGSFATLAALTVAYDRGWRFRAVAVGDSCLFLTDRSGAIRRSFPYQHPEEFSRPPIMIAASTSNNKSIPARGIRCRDELRLGEAVWLASDEVSRWVLSAESVGANPFYTLGKALASQRAFEGFVDDLRRSSLVADDDMSVVRVTRR
jgi:hypothetical protein